MGKLLVVVGSLWASYYLGGLPVPFVAKPKMMLLAENVFISNDAPLDPNQSSTTHFKHLIKSDWRFGYADSVASGFGVWSDKAINFGLVQIKISRITHESPHIL